MTEKSANRVLARISSLAGRPWRAFRAAPRRVQAIVAIVLAVACGAAGVVAIGPALAGPDQTAGQPVPDGDLPAVVAAAVSCPTLTAPRLAASLMAASGFDATAVNSAGGVGIAALSTADWMKWRPWPEATRSDDRANIFAFAHRTCDAIGELRAAKVAGDLWQASVAADYAGLPAVIKARRIPADAQGYVDKVAGYAKWYAGRQQLSGRGTQLAKAGTGPATTDVPPVPDAYLPDVLAAGKLCPTVTPARIAAQLMVASRFNSNLTGPGGSQGIAQFLPEAWERYRPSAKASSWNPHEAVPALGTAMCDLVKQMSGLPGADPYPLALAAFQWGTYPVRAASGVPRVAGIQQLSDVVPGYADSYAKDSRLGPPPAGPAGPSASPSPAASPTTAKGVPPVPAPAAQGTPIAPGGTPGGKSIIGRQSGKCLLPTVGGDGAHVVLWTCNGSLTAPWQLGTDGTIRAVGLCMDAAWGSTEQGTIVQVANCSGNVAQQFYLNNNQIIGRQSNMCVDVAEANTTDGAKVVLWPCTGKDNQNWTLG